MSRAYALTKLQPGDWLCLSNDGRRVWRFHTFEDGKVHGLDVDYECRTFWRAVWVDRATFEEWGYDDIPSPWNRPWVEGDTYLPTRTAAINLMLLEDQGE